MHAASEWRTGTGSVKPFVVVDALQGVEYMGLQLHTGDLKEVARWLVDCASSAHTDTTIVTHINVNNYYWLRRHPEWRERVQSECVLLLDGIGVKIGAFLLRRGWLPDLNGTDLFPLVMDEAEHRRLRIFLLGGRKDVVDRSVEVVGRRYPGIRVVGSHSGYFHRSDEGEITARIRASAPHLLLVGCGFLRQEEFSLSWREELRVPLIWNVGGLFDFVSGHKPRAPLWMRRARLEWAFRFLLEPRRMWHRNLVAAPCFLVHVLRRSTGREHRAWGWMSPGSPRTARYD